MIAKGNLHANGRKLAAYITTGKDGERAEMVEARGFASADLREGFATIEAIAATQTHCVKPFFHAYVRLPAGESLDREKWLGVADRIERRLGFDGQPRAVAFHIAQDGETHLHVAWSRIDTEAMRAIDPGLYKNALKAICRDVEREFALREVASERDNDQHTRSAARAEFEQARRLGIDVTEVRETIRICLDRSDSGPSFVAALDEHGLNLARGDQRDFVVVDQEGGLHALSKRITGLTAEQTRERLGSHFSATLPTIEDARRQQEARQELARPAEAQQAVSAVPDARQHRAELKAEITALWMASVSGEAFVAAVAERGYTLCQGDRRAMVLLDREGDTYSLPRLIEGARTADVRAQLADANLASWPTVAAARETLALRGENFDRDAADQAWQDKVADAALRHVQSTVTKVGDRSESGVTSQEHALDRATTPSLNKGETIERTLSDADQMVTGTARSAARILANVGKLAEGMIKAVDGLFPTPAPAEPEQSKEPPPREPEPVPLQPAVDAMAEQQRQEAIARTAQTLRDAMRDDPEREAGYLGPDTPLERTRGR